eukprot:scaffold34986_cov2104-Skeletonema_dohrnii-CCMP3373.AAC.2
MAKKILYQDNARRALERGMEIMVEAVSVTLGPKGRNVVLEKTYGSPQIVNDGVTIAKEIKLADHIENTGVSLIRQAASKTNDVAGDGTTTATVLAYAMVKEGLKNVAAGANPISIKLGMEKATQYLVMQINEFAQPVEDIQSIKQVASISAGNDDIIGALIADALAKVGKEGVISLEEGKGIVTELEITEGMKLEKAVRAPGFGELRKLMLQDIAVLTGGTVITQDADTTTIVGDGLEIDNIKARCEQLRKQVNVAETGYEKEKLQDRIAKLSGGIAVIRVGAVTETEMKDKKLRLEDAINATRAAVEEGIVPGGGATLAHLAENLVTWAKNNLKEDELIGALIISRAIVAPLKRIAENAGINGPVIIGKVQEQEFEIGYNAAKNIFGDMYVEGVVDPAKVTRSGLQNATSIASMILTTECIIVDDIETSK